MQATATEENPTRDSAENAEEGAPAQSGHASPAYLSSRDAMQGCGGAAPFATFHGSGSVGDQPVRARRPVDLPQLSARR